MLVVSTVVAGGRVFEIHCSPPATSMLGSTGVVKDQMNHYRAQMGYAFLA